MYIMDIYAFHKNRDWWEKMNQTLLDIQQYIYT